MKFWDKIKDLFHGGEPPVKQTGWLYPTNTIPPASVLIFRSAKTVGAIIRFIRRIQTKIHVWSNHAGLYFGSGRRETIEAMFNGVRKATLDESMDKRTAIKVYAKKDLTVQQLQIIKAYAYGSVGRDYNYTGLIGFITGNHGPDDENWCSENVVQCYDQAGVKVSNKPDHETAPDTLEVYLESKEAQDNGWTLINTYNC
jgi:hypothetical protein